MQIGIDFKSGLDVELTAMGIPIGITDFFLKGDLVCLFTPPMTQPPFFGGVQVYFPNPPDIGLNFVGAAKVTEIPGLRGAVRGAIDGAVGGVCVLPRRIAVDMNEEDDVDIIDLTYPEPIGILRFTLWSGAKLVASDVSIFGTATAKSTSKSGFQPPKHIMANSDLARIINSDEVQSAVRPAKSNDAKFVLKKNPLKNLGAMVKLNPYALTLRRAELQRQEAISKKSAAVAARRAAKRAKQKKYAKGSKKFYSNLLV